MVGSHLHMVSRLFETRVWFGYPSFTSRLLSWHLCTCILWTGESKQRRSVSMMWCEHYLTATRYEGHWLDGCGCSTSVINMAHRKGNQINWHPLYEIWDILLTEKYLVWYDVSREKFTWICFGRRRWWTFLRPGICFGIASCSSLRK